MGRATLQRQKIAGRLSAVQDGGDVDTDASRGSGNGDQVAARKRDFTVGSRGTCWWRGYQGQNSGVTARLSALSSWVNGTAIWQDG